MDAGMGGVRALVMAGGKGSRLAPFTDVVPKPALPVANEPMMGHVLRGLARNGITDVVSTTHHLAEVMPRVFGDGSRYGVRLTLDREPTLMGTAGGMKRVEGFLRSGDDSPFVVLSGDGLHDVDLRALVDEHTRSGGMATFALHEVDDPSRYGVVVLDDAGQVRGFQEKPAEGTAESRLASTGIYVFDPQVFDHIPADTVQDFGNDVFPSLLAKGIPLHGVRTEGYWNDVGTLASYRQGNLDAAAGRIDGVGPAGSSAVRQAMDGVHRRSQVAEGASLVGTSVIGAGARIDAGASVIESVVLPGTHLPGGSVVANGVVGDLAALRHWADTGAR